MEYMIRVYNFLQNGTIDNIQYLCIQRKSTPISQTGELIYGIYETINQNNLFYN